MKQKIVTTETVTTERKKVLYAAATAQHLSRFHVPYIEALRAEYDVLTMASGEGVDLPVPIKRSVFSPSNLRAVREIRRILKQEKFDAAILNTSLAAFLIRVAMIGLKHKPKVFNFVHGYLFSHPVKGLRARLLLLCEKLTKGYTDEIAVMNENDREIAERYRLCRGEIHMTRGVGYSFPKELPSGKELRERLDPKGDSLLLTYVGLLGGTKDQSFLIRMTERLRREGIPARLVLVGDGVDRADLESEAHTLGVADQVVFAGEQASVWEYLAATDLYTSASRKEGLPLNIMEAMAMGLPILAANDHKGQRELLKSRTESIYPIGDENAFCEAVERIWKSGKYGAGAVSYPELAAYSFARVFSENVVLMKGFLEK